MQDEWGPSASRRSSPCARSANPSAADATGRWRRNVGMPREVPSRVLAIARRLPRVSPGKMHQRHLLAPTGDGEVHGVDTPGRRAGA